jgi:ATP-dependent Clp protease protease subunit
MKRKPYSMQAKNGTGEIFIYDDIGGGFFDDGITSKSFAEDLRALGGVNLLNIFINSPGGSVFHGISIHNQLARHRARKVVHIDGIAASIASVIAMVGDDIVIAENGMIMIHEPFAMAAGTAADMRKMAESLDKVSDTILTTYAARTGAAEGQISAMMAEETWLNAAEAVELGFADSIGNEVQIAAMDLAKFKNVPETLSTAVADAKGQGLSPLSLLAETEDGTVVLKATRNPVLAEMWHDLKAAGLERRPAA